MAADISSSDAVAPLFEIIDARVAPAAAPGDQILKGVSLHIIVHRQNGDSGGPELAERLETDGFNEW